MPGAKEQDIRRDAYFEVAGCTMNQGESQLLRRIAIEEGWGISHDPASALVCVISTCTVIGKTQSRMEKRIAEIVALCPRVIVSGCMASAQAELVLSRFPGVVILAPRELEKFRQMLRDIAPSGGPGAGSGEVSCGCATSPGTEWDHTPAQAAHAIVCVSQGCLGSCTYCITRLARGRLTSYPIEGIVAEARRALGAGFREIRLTAQDFGTWGADSGKDLLDMVTQVASMDGFGEYMVRLGMTNPDRVAGRLDLWIRLLSNPRVFSFLHMPLQSGSDAILARMGRHYSASDFLAAVKGLRSGLGEAGRELLLSTDVISGFPGESDEDHAATIRAMEESRPDIVNIKAFSPRDGTPAADFAPRVDGRIVKERTRQLSTLHLEISAQNGMAEVGKVREALHSENDPAGRSMVFRTDSYRPVVVKEHAGPLPITGSIRRIKITGASRTYCTGEIVE